MNHGRDEVSQRLYKAHKTEGWMDKVDLEFLAQLANVSDVTLEIGCYKGRTTHVLSLSKVLFTVDPFIGVHSEEGIKEDYLKNIPYKNTFLIEACFYKTVVPKVIFACNKPDLIFIDGNHEEEEVDNDIRYALELIKNDGIIAGHDINNTYPGVRKSVEKYFKHYLTTEKQGGNIWYSTFRNKEKSNG